jgi:hypothetical protein
VRKFSIDEKRTIVLSRWNSLIEECTQMGYTKGWAAEVLGTDWQTVEAVTSSPAPWSEQDLYVIEGAIKRMWNDLPWQRQVDGVFPSLSVAGKNQFMKIFNGGMNPYDLDQRLSQIADRQQKNHGGDGGSVPSFTQQRDVAEDGRQGTVESNLVYQLICEIRATTGRPYSSALAVLLDEIGVETAEGSLEQLWHRRQRGLKLPPARSVGPGAAFPPIAPIMPGRRRR